MELSQNLKRFLQLFFRIPESTRNFQYVKKKAKGERWFLSQIIDWKLRSYLNAQKASVSEH